MVEAPAACLFEDIQCEDIQVETVKFLLDVGFVRLDLAASDTDTSFIQRGLNKQGQCFLKEFKEQVNS